jgi:hypothetical protein
MSRSRTAAVVCALGALAVGGLAGAGTGAGAQTAASTGTDAPSATSQAPSAVLTADAARTVDVSRAPTLQGPQLPSNAFINRPTIPLSEYRAIKGGPRADRRSGSGTLSAAPAATNLGGFNGITQATAQDTFPPDINGAVGGNQVAEIVNQHLTVFNKSTFAQVSDASLATVTGYTTTSIFDPRLLFDTTWHRWVAIAEARPQSAGLQNFFIVISVNNNASGPYFVYNFNINGACGSGNFYDYPQLGMNQDAIVVTGNCFQGNTYLGARVFGVAKALLYNGFGFSVPIFSVATADSTTTPSQVFDQNPHMDMLTRNGPHQVRFNLPAYPGFQSLTDFGTVTGFFPPSVPRNAGQAGCTVTSCLLDTSDGRFQAPGVQFGNELWNVATYGLSGSGTFATPTWGEFNTTTHATIQSGQRFLDGCSDDFNASIQASNANRAWLNWTSTDPQGSSCGQTFVRQVIATRQAADTAGTFPSLIVPFTSPAELTGNFDSNFGTQRWGDTSSMSRDPSNATIAWSWNESVPNNSNWGTRAQKIQN